MDSAAAPPSSEVAGPPPSDPPVEIRRAPAPLHGGPLALLRFMRRQGMLTPKYLRLIVRLLRKRYLTSYGRRIDLDGLAFIGPNVVIQIGRQGRLKLGRWSWIGHGTKIR